MRARARGGVRQRRTSVERNLHRTNTSAFMDKSEANTSHGDWAQYYQRNLASQPPGGGGGTGAVFGRASPLAESTVVTTTMTPASPAAAGGSSSTAPPASEGRVGKAARRRSRASRKAPTTTLNTDTTNFRALVQQFTGAPSGPFLGAGYLDAAAAGVGGGGPTTLNFGLHRQQPAVFPFGAPQQFPLYQQHQERPPFMLGAGGGSGVGDGDGDVFLQGYGLGDVNPARGNMDVSDGYLLGGISSSSSSSQISTGCRTSDGFLF